MSKLATFEPKASSNEYLIRDGNFVRRTVNEEIVGDVESMLNSLIEPTPFLIKNLGALNSQPVHALLGPSYQLLIIELRSLPMMMNMHLSPDGQLLYLQDINGFNISTPSPGAVMIREPWTVPPFLRLFFVLNTQFNDAIECCLFFKTKQNEFLAPFYPNIHDNGRVCMGPVWDNNKNKDCPSLFDKFIRAYNSFHDTKMNHHLTGEAHRSLYRRDVKPDGTHSWRHFSETEENKYGVSTSMSFMPFLKGL